MSIFASVLELLSLGLMIPIIYFIVNPNNDSLQKIISFFKINLNEISLDELYSFFIISLIFVFFLKTIYLSYFTKYQLIFKRNLKTNFSHILFTKYLKLQYVKAIKQGFAEMQKNISEEVQRFTELVLNYIMFINEFIMLISILTFLFFFNFQVTLIVTIIFSLIFIILVVFFKNRFQSWGKKSQEAHASYNNTLLQSFNNIREIKLQAKESFFINNFLIDNKLKNYLQYRYRLYQALPRYFIELIAVLVIFIILYVMVKGNKDLDYVLATLGVFTYASVRLLPLLNKLTHLVGDIRFLSYSAELVSKELNFLNKNYNLNNRQELYIDKIQTIELSNIEFSYKKPVLNKLSLQLNKGSITGVFGESGAGKTTLLDILSSLIIPDKGQIFINNKNIDPKNFFWGKSVGYISQSSDLFNDTIRNNIAFGEIAEDIDEEKIKYSLGASNLNEFIKELPDGIDTMVGEKGSQISSGQKQRINIARAFYNDTKVLIMDESTNALDAENEANIFNDISKIKENLIVLVISHDKELLKKFCDNIFVLKNKKLSKI